jgi:hypothetical protein
MVLAHPTLASRPSEEEGVGCAAAEPGGCPCGEGAGHGRCREYGKRINNTKACTYMQF